MSSCETYGSATDFPSLSAWDSPKSGPKSALMQMFRSYNWTKLSMVNVYSTKYSAMGQMLQILCEYWGFKSVNKYLLQLWCLNFKPIEYISWSKLRAWICNDVKQFVVHLCIIQYRSFQLNLVFCSVTWGSCPEGWNFPLVCSIHTGLGVNEACVGVCVRKLSVAWTANR